MVIFQVKNLADLNDVGALHLSTVGLGDDNLRRLPVLNEDNVTTTLARSEPPERTKQDFHVVVVHLWRPSAKSRDELIEPSHSVAEMVPPAVLDVNG
jgi:hypothetical protein